MDVETLGQSRDSLYEQYEKAQGGEPLKEKVKEEVKTEESETAKTDKKETEKKEEEVKTESSTEKKDEPTEKAEVEKVKVEDFKTTPKEETKDTKVPYDALHAEREKRKAAQVRIRELESQINLVLQETKKKAEEKPETVDDYEKEIITLRKEVKSLREDLSSQKKNLETEASQKKITEIESKISTVDRELKEEGFPLFKDLQDQVTKEIVKMIDGDPDSGQGIIREYDNPNGWKKIYKEKIFPRLDSTFKERYQSSTKKEKEELKKQANLTGGSAPRVSLETKEDEYSYDDYLKRRKEALIK